MNRRLIMLSLLLAAVLGTVAVAIDGVDVERKAKGERWTVELLSAQGLSKGSDARIGGVRAGKIESIELDRRTRRAKVDIVLTQPGFDTLKADAFCQLRPQQLIGEYFLDCQPGTSRQALAGRTLPANQTSGSIGFDLLNSVLRRPYAERFRLIFAELGIGVAARGPEINETLRRAVPAIRDTNKVLRTLALQKDVIADLVRNADRALGPLAVRREDINRFVKETGDTAEASADRKAELAGQFREFPGFLREAVPTMKALGASSESQARAFAELSEGAPQLQRLFEATGRFTESLVPATRSLAKTARNGRGVVRDAGATVSELSRFGKDLPELAGNLAVVLEHLNDRDNAVEPDKRSPGGKGFTGYEALLQFIRNQALAINVYDGDGYKLKSTMAKDVLACSSFGEAAAAKARPECIRSLGPNLPGITTPDPSAAGAPARRSVRAKDLEIVREALERTAAPADRARRPADEGAPGGSAPSRSPGPAAAPDPALPTDAPLPETTQRSLLDFLLG